jgi:ABC-2 type transport system permease protein
MLNIRLVSLVYKEFIQIVRDPRTLALTFLMPVVQLFLLGYAATNDVRNVALAVYDQDQSAASRSLVAAYRNADYFRLDYVVGSEAELRRLIDSGQARAGLIIPPDYGRRLARGEAAQVAFVLDGSDPTVGGSALSAATLIGQAKATALTVERLAAHGVKAPSPALEVRTKVWYNPDLLSAYYTIPGMIGIILQFLTTILTSTAIVRERERGTIEQLIVTPLMAWELVVGKLTPYTLIAFGYTIEILVVGVVLFHIPINGSVPLLLALAALFLVSSLGIGLFISTISNTQQEAIMSAMFVMLPSIFLSGFFFPLAAMPTWLQAITYAIPLRYFLVIVRGIVLKGVGADALWPEIAALSVFAVVIMGSAAARFRKRLD